MTALMNLQKLLAVIIINLFLLTMNAIMLILRLYIPTRYHRLYPLRGKIWCTIPIPTELLLLTTSFDIISRKNLEIFLTNLRL